MMNGIDSDGTTSAIVGQTTSSIISDSTVIRNENQFVIAECRRNTDSNGLTHNSAIQETTDDSDVEEKILAVYWRAGKLGAAYFTLQTGELFVLEEIVDRPPAHQMLCNLFRMVEPAKILLDGKMQGTFVGTVKRIVFADGNEDGRCKLIFVNAKEYSFEACKRRIFSLSLPNEPKPCTEEERTMFLRTAVNFSQTQSVHSLGALLRYVDLNWSNLSMDLHSKPQFLSLRKISLVDIVTIDEDTYKGLQIFSCVGHPSGFKRGARGSAREGLSLFQLFNKCCSKVGQSKMRVLFQHPTMDLEVIKRRQDAVAHFMRSQSETTARGICSALRYIKNVNGILAKIKALSAKVYQWKSLYNTLYNAVLICEMCEASAEGCELLQQLGSCDNHKLYEMALYMNRIIDFENSKTEGKFTVKPGVDPQLDRKKQTMASLHGLMSETAKVELERLPAFVEECAMVYMPHLGYLLAIKAWAQDLRPDDKEIPNLRFMFQNNEYIHYKSKGCEELDVMIGDTYPEIVAHETKIMMRLTSIILENLDTLSSVIEKCAELDCLIAISKVCKDLNFVRPTMTTDNIISVTQGRHPLHILTNDQFVPNDLQCDEAKVHVLTGPNASGKSVYMKMIGLIVYLAHIGSFVPASAATIGVLSHLHTRIQSTECVAQHMSAFLIDLRQMALALQESTANSLIIIDEFGKGTAEIDGIALLASCVNSFLYREEYCPHVLLATHMLQLPEYLIKTSLVKFQQFEVMVQAGEPVPLFRLTAGAVRTFGAAGGSLVSGAERSSGADGESGAARGSGAAGAARTAGLSSHVVDRASIVMRSLMNNALPSENKKITDKLKAIAELMKTDLLEEDA